MLGDTSIPLAVRTGWVWAEVARRHPYIRRDLFLLDPSDIWCVHELLVEDSYKYTPRRGDRVMDIGANKGVFTLMCALAGAAVTSYEPHAPVYEILRRNLELNNLPTVNAHRIGVWKETTTANLWEWPDSPYASTFLAHGDLDRARVAPVYTVSLNEAVGVTEWDCVKMDVEGGEYDILLSASCDTLRRIKYLTMELHNDLVSDRTYEDLMAHLSRHFDLSGVLDRGRWSQLHAARKGGQ